MTATELQDVQALLDRVLPDPRGFAGRLLQQVVTEYGLIPEPARAQAAFYAAEDAVPGDDFIVADSWPGNETRHDETAPGETLGDEAAASGRLADGPSGEPAPDAATAASDINILLAAALGACECWGARAGCDLCLGQGASGWTQPDPELFDEFVRPALERLSAALRDEGDDHHDSATWQGE
jgi:hypothetical protein